MPFVGHESFDQVAFEVDVEAASGPEVRVKVNRRDLVELIGEFERSQGFDPAGGYGGLIPSLYRFGPMSQHFLGGVDRSKVPVLGCECGEWGCWPLMVRISVNDGKVRWSEFGQGQRVAWDYGPFGTLVFEQASYEDALRELEDQLRSAA